MKQKLLTRPIGVHYYVQGHTGPVQTTAFSAEANAVARVSYYAFLEQIDRAEIFDRRTGAVLDTCIWQNRTLTWWFGGSAPKLLSSQKVIAASVRREARQSVFH